jgi:UDP-N-acetylglucosamine 2-epimerase
MRILLVFGTRPEIIKLGPVFRALNDAGADIDVFWSGQHVELADGLLDLFGMTPTYRGADTVLQMGLAGKHGVIMQQLDKILREVRYDWVVVQGDTTTAAAAATAAFTSRVPVAHVEAGLRTGTIMSPWPEEFNRRVIGQAAALHFVPTALARDNLLKESVSPRRIVVVGNTVVDALLYVRSKAGLGYAPRDPDVASLPADKKLVLVTLHRRENIGEPMRDILLALRELGGDGDKIIVLPVHLNPGVRAEVKAILGDVPNVRLLAPLFYADFVHLLGRAWTVVTDSGGVQEEAPTFGLQILIARESTERPEVIDAGFGTLVGSDRAKIVDGVRRLTGGGVRQLLPPHNPFGDGAAARRIAERLTASNVKPIECYTSHPGNYTSRQASR